MIENSRLQFPILNQQIHSKPLIYLDNAASTQKPISVIEAVDNYYYTINSNVHRGAHLLSQLATDAFETARKNVAQFINAKHPHEVIFTRGTTEAINLVAFSFSQAFIRQGDEIIISAMEHHSNIVPWQMAAERYGASLKIIPILENGDLDIDSYKKLFSKNTKIVAITHVSNVLGTINPIKEIINIAHQHQVPVLIDGAQGIKSTKVDVQDLNCDFYCFSGHKIYAPMGIGILYGKEDLLEKIPPYHGGGEMIKKVTFEKTTFNELPFKFEAGTPNVGGAIGLNAAIQFIQQFGIEKLIEHDTQLLQYALQQMQILDNIRYFGETENKGAVISFLLGNSHPADVGTLLNSMGIAVRTGHHCAEPLMDIFQIPGTVRISFAIYNTKDEIDTFVKTLVKINKMLE